MHDVHMAQDHNACYKGEIPGRESEPEHLPGLASAAGATLETGEEREALSQRELSFETA